MNSNHYDIVNFHEEGQKLRQQFNEGLQEMNRKFDEDLQELNRKKELALSLLDFKIKCLENDKSDYIKNM